MILTLAGSASALAVDSSLPPHTGWALAIAGSISIVLAAIEITRESKKPLASCMVVQALFYCCILVFGNVVTTLIASTLVLKLPTSLVPYYFVFAVFFGVFAFEAILKNTNITVLGNGVLTIETWIGKALSAAAGAAIERDAQRSASYRAVLAGKLASVPEGDLNAFVLHKLGNGGADFVQKMDNAAKTNKANRTLYKALAIVTVVPSSEVSSFLRQNAKQNSDS